MGVDARMFVGLKEKMEPLAIRHLAADCAAAFGPQKFWIKRPDAGYGKAHHVFEENASCEYSEEDAYFKDHHAAQWLRVFLWGRYYGEGYERGDFPLYYALAKWIDTRLPGSVILYGGDTGGEYELFDTKRREDLFAHFARVAHKPYRGAFAGIYGAKSVPLCDFCQVPLVNYGGGQGDIFYRCDSCEFKAIASEGLLREIEGDFFERKFKGVAVKIDATPPRQGAA